MRIAYFQVAPEALKALTASRPYIAASNIEPRLRALVELRVSQINGCAYCVNMHSQKARQAGEVQQRLDCLPVWRETPFYNARERAALAWAESVTLVSQSGVPDAVYEEVHGQFSDRDLVDLTLMISVMNAMNRMGISFRQEPLARPVSNDS
ncbi:carboxymuconolactone decarboxylase family protein [soil metagenome]